MSILNYSYKGNLPKNCIFTLYYLLSVLQRCKNICYILKRIMQSTSESPPGFGLYPYKVEY